MNKRLVLTVDDDGNVFDEETMSGPYDPFWLKKGRRVVADKGAVRISLPMTDAMPGRARGHDVHEASRGYAPPTVPNYRLSDAEMARHRPGPVVLQFERGSARHVADGRELRDARALATLVRDQWVREQTSAWSRPFHDDLDPAMRPPGPSYYPGHGGDKDTNTGPWNGPGPYAANGGDDDDDDGDAARDSMIAEQTNRWREPIARKADPYAQNVWRLQKGTGAAANQREVLTRAVEPSNDAAVTFADREAVASRAAAFQALCDERVNAWRK
jgi:hypothetical protein